MLKWGMASLRFVHTSDVHLGARFERLGSRAPEFRKLLNDTFIRIIDRALKADLLLIAGDLFDRPLPSRSVLDFFVAQMERLAAQGVHTVIIAGNHDFWSEKSIYASPVFQRLKNVHVLSPEQPLLELKEKDVAVFGTSCTSKQSTSSPLLPLIAMADTSVLTNKIALIHGSLTIPEKHSARDYPFSTEEIVKSPFAYVACGNWHSGFEVVKGRSWYSGAPEPLSTQQSGAGQVVVGEIEGGVTTQLAPEKIGTITFSVLNIGVDETTTPAELLTQISHGADSYMVRTVKVSGIVQPGQRLELEKISDQAARHFYHLNIVDDTHVALTPEALNQFPEELVIGQYVRILQEKIAAAPDAAQRKLHEEALQLGVALLQDGEQL